VEESEAGVVGEELDFGGEAGGGEDYVFEEAAELGAVVDAADFEGAAVEMDGVSVHALILHDEAVALAGGEDGLVGVGVGLAVDEPLLFGTVAVEFGVEDEVDAVGFAGGGAGGFVGGAEVRRPLHLHEPLYHVEADLIRDLHPDLLITQMHYDVCAVTPDDVERVGCNLLASQVLALGAGTVDGIFDGIRSIARSLHLPSAGEDLIAAMRCRIRTVTDAVRNNPTPTVVMLEWTDPIFSMGNWGPELVEAANGRVLLGEKGQFSRAIPWQEVRDADPDFLIIAPCGYDIPRTVRELPLLEALPGWSQLKSVRAGTVAVADGNLYFNRSGTTIVRPSRS
jgi:ABC-type Fe3+-hydroxamate transport system substrate-binding protein